MFSYQCRYCKSNFDQWGELVAHRKDEHYKELENLKYALYLRNIKRDSSPKKEIDSKRGKTLNGISKNSSLKQILPLIKMNLNRRSSPAAIMQVPIVQKTPSKEVDAKDLENREISLRVPTIECSNNPAEFKPSEEKEEYRILPSASSFATPPPRNRMILQNGGSTIKERILVGTSSNFLTPPATPSPSSLSGELVLNLNWEVPFNHPCKKAVLYHEIDDDKEIEICALPSTLNGSRISLTKHSVSRHQAMNGHSSNGKAALEDAVDIDESDKFVPLKTNHVVVDNLDNELLITCSKFGSFPHSGPSKLRGQLNSSVSPNHHQNSNSTHSKISSPTTSSAERKRTECKGVKRLQQIQLERRVNSLPRNGTINVRNSNGKLANGIARYSPTAKRAELAHNIPRASPHRRNK